MRSMSVKKKNLTNGHNLDKNNNKPYNGPNGPVVYIPAYIIPKGYQGACHLHKKILLFRTMDDLMKHDAEWHDYRKMRVL